jgi:hypothetical protein
MNSQGVP